MNRGRDSSSGTTCNGASVVGVVSSLGLSSTFSVLGADVPSPTDPLE